MGRELKAGKGSRANTLKSNTLDIQLSVSLTNTSEEGTSGRLNVKTNKTPKLPTTGMVTVNRTGPGTGNSYIFLPDGESPGQTVYVIWNNSSTESLYLITEKSLVDGTNGTQMDQYHMYQCVWSGDLWYQVNDNIIK